MKELELYHAFSREHRGNIERELKTEFADFYEKYRSHTVWAADFGGMVGIPLFILTVLWLVSTKAENYWFVVVAMVAFGFLLRYYQSHTIKIACERFFWKRKCEIIADYVDAQMHAVMEKQPAEQHSETHELYKYFYRQLVSIDYKLWK